MPLARPSSSSYWRVTPTWLIDFSTIGWNALVRRVVVLPLK